MPVYGPHRPSHTKTAVTGNRMTPPHRTFVSISARKVMSRSLSRVQADVSHDGKGKNWRMYPEIIGETERERRVVLVAGCFLFSATYPWLDDRYLLLLREIHSDGKQAAWEAERAIPIFPLWLSLSPRPRLPLSR